MLRQAIAAEFFKASRRWSLLFWGFAFVPFCSFVINIMMQLNPITVAGLALHADLFSKLFRALEFSSSPLAQVFYIAAGAVIFGAEYESESRRLLIPRAPRIGLIVAKVLLYAACALSSLILIIVGACLATLFGAVKMRIPILWQATTFSPASAIAMVACISWAELMILGLSAGLIAVISRAVLVPVVSLILAAFCQALLMSILNFKVPTATLAFLPGLCAEIGRLFLTHTEISPGQYINPREAAVAMALLCVWLLVSLSLTLWWFKNQEFKRE
jgi:ABC-2 type transport system permease protein